METNAHRYAVAVSFSPRRNIFVWTDVRCEINDTCDTEIIYSTCVYASIFDFVAFLNSERKESTEIRSKGR